MNPAIQQRVEQYHADPVLAERANAHYARLLERSAVDREFRQLLLTDPRAALATFSGRDIGDFANSPNIRFIENTADATIVLPDFTGNTELSDRELETVAGGTVDIGSVVATAVILYDAATEYVRSHTVMP